MIRQATLEDIPAIREMASVVFPATYGEILSAEQLPYMMDMMYSEESLRRQMTERGNVFFICEGQGYVSYRYDRPAEDGGEIYHLEKIYVLPQCQGSGLGRKLFGRIVEEVRARSKGPARIELNVNRQNRAVTFYEHLGMRKDRSGDFPIGNGFFMNDFIMTLDV